MPPATESRCDVAVIGGGVGGVAAALAAARAGCTVVLTEEHDWLGGQLTSQAVPPDEHRWVERFGVTASYRDFRDRVRAYYRTNYPLTGTAYRWRELNPGAGAVSKLCHEPRVALAVLNDLLASHRSSGLITVLQPFVPARATTEGDRVTSVTVRSVRTGDEVTISAPIVLDATEIGDLLPLTGTEYVTGFESRSDTEEPHAPEEAQPLNMQAVSACFAVDHVDGNHTIDRPAGYDRWRSYEPSFWGSPLFSWVAPNPRNLQPDPRVFVPNPPGDPQTVVSELDREGGDINLWTFRRIAARENFTPGAYPSDITLVNWPMIDYFDGPVFEVPDAAMHAQQARELSRSFLYWMQTEAPRVDGGTGYPGLRLRGDVTGDDDGLAMALYIREPRRIRAQYTVVEQDVSMSVRREQGAVSYPDSVGIGMYRIDLHPSTGGDNYIDVGAAPFEIPLGALLPQRMRNLVAAAKNIGTTHITNGCYRLHPVEWNIGEVAGLLAAQCRDLGLEPAQIRSDRRQLADFQNRLTRAGVELHWPRIVGY